jgi:hypothetical protein
METFIVRVWVPVAVKPRRDDLALHGVVEHVGSQRSRTFHSDAELLRFVHDCLGEDRVDPAGPLP